MKGDTTAPYSSKLRLAGKAMALLAIALAIACVISFYRDSKHLRQVALQVVGDTSNDREKVVALANWVHNNKGSHENENHFIFRSLRATPLLVLQGGGDCADKSRLLWAMLCEIGIKSTMVMCFHRDTGAPTHTVVEAQTQSGERILVDPVYGLDFPKQFPGEYYGLLDLRTDPHILDRRLNELLSTAPRSSPLRSYNPTSAAYDQASSFNWNKNAITNTARRLLAYCYGNEVYRLPRPAVLEEPKLFVAAILTAFSAFVLVATRLASTIFNRLLAVPEGVALCGR